MAPGGVAPITQRLFAAFGAGLAILLSQGLLYAYAFTAINRVSAGDFKSFMPNISDVSDLVDPMRVGLAALLISTGPLLLLAFLHPPEEVFGAIGVSAPAALTGQPTPSPEPSVPPELQALRDETALAGEPTADGESAANGEGAGSGGAAGEPGRGATGGHEKPGVPGWVILAYVGAILWKILYSPVALVAAAISHGFFATLNPLAGIGAIQRMGGTYWSAMGVYTLIALVETVLVAGLGMIPLAGRFLAAFVQSYTYLAIGCLLGLAVFKKATELGLD